MNAVKTPQEKKRLSLKTDHRNVYGESPHASRKSIPRRKQIRHQEERRTAKQALAGVEIETSEDSMASAEILSDVRAKQNRLRGFRKSADAPLEVFLARQRARRLLSVGRKKSARG